MELHKNTTNAFIDYLKKHGYPEDSIITEWGDNKHQIDIAILDEDINYPVAIYEIEGKRNMNSLIQGLAQLKKIQSFIGYPVETGLVFSTDTEPYFEVFKTNDYLEIKEEKEIINRFFHGTVNKDDKPIDYKIISNSAEPKINKTLSTRKNRYLDWYKFISWFFCSVLIVLLIIENLGYINFTIERLIVMGVIIVVALIPFFSEIKIGDVSLKRPRPDGSKKDEQ